MLRVISQASAFRKIPVTELRSGQNTCVMCQNPVTEGFVFIDDQGLTGNVPGSVICPTDAETFLETTNQQQRPVTPQSSMETEQPMVEPFTR